MPSILRADFPTKPPPPPRRLRNAIDKVNVAHHNDLVKKQIMVSLCRAVLLILTGLLATTVFLWLISSDSALRIASDKFEPARNARTQRYLQFSGMPGVMLYGFRQENSAIDPEKAGVPRWILELRALRRDEIEEREKTSTSPEGRNRPRFVLGYSSESHGKPDSAFFAIYRYISLPALTILWVVLIAGLGGALCIRRSNRRVGGNGSEGDRPAGEQPFLPEI